MSRKAKKRKNYAEEDMEKAIDAVKKKELSYLKSAAFYHVLVGTLHRLCSKRGSGEELAKTKLGRKPYLPLELERLLVEYAFVLETNYFGMTRSDLRRMAFQLALRNDLSHPFLNEIAGKKWLRLFRRRHPTVSLRIPEATSIARVRAFTKAKVGRFFDLLESEMEKLKFSPDRIYNVDETGLCIVQSKKEAVIALKGKKQVGQLTSAERGALITVIACMNPVGQYIPPFLIFPRVKVPASYLDGTPFNTDYDCHKSGWIQMDIFTKWFQHFLKYAKPTKELPVLLILDGHNTHTRNADVIELARKNNVVIISIPPHTSHKTQPLDRTFMGPLKAYYSSEVRKFLRDKKRAVELRDVGALFGSAYKNAARYDIAENGFKCTGIYPVNRNIFTDNEYTPTPEENDELQDELNEDQPALTTTTISPIPIPPTDLNATSASTTTSTLPVQIPPVDSNTTLLSSSFILPEQITPIPVLEKKKKVTRGRKPGKSEIITSSPYKNALANNKRKVNINQSLEIRNLPPKMGNQLLEIGK